MEFIKKIDEFYKSGQEVKLFLDMDGTVVEFIFDLDNSFNKKGGYIMKRPIRPIVEKIKEINHYYPSIEIYILSCSSSKDMTREKNEWLDIYMPFIDKKNRIIIEENDVKHDNAYSNTIKTKFINNNIMSDELVIFIDDDCRILCETQKVLKNRVLPIHVTSLLI